MPLPATPRHPAHACKVAGDRPATARDLFSCVCRKQPATYDDHPRERAEIAPTIAAGHEAVRDLHRRIAAAGAPAWVAAWPDSDGIRSEPGVGGASGDTECVPTT